MRVVGQFEIEKFNCQRLDNNVFQLAVILYPSELFNEKFLINIRNCMIKLGDDHPVKMWIKHQFSPERPDNNIQEKIDFLNEILNSQFNLITDQKIKIRVIEMIGENPAKTHLEKILQSYLYLMIGNISRSDLILKEIIQTKPRDFYEGFGEKRSYFHTQTLINLEKVLSKFSRHPADRLTFYLFTQYLQSYTNKVELLDKLDELDVNLKDKIELAYTEKIAPELVGYLRLSGMSEKRRIKKLRGKTYSQETQSYWFWPFMDLDPLYSETSIEQIKHLDSTDPLWAIYVLENEKLSDLYTKKGGTPFMKRRSFLREELKKNEEFMLVLFKLIELGDIDDKLVRDVSSFMTHAR